MNPIDEPGPTGDHLRQTRVEGTTKPVPRGSAERSGGAAQPRGGSAPVVRSDRALLANLAAILEARLGAPEDPLRPSELGTELRVWARDLGFRLTEPSAARAARLANLSTGDLARLASILIRIAPRRARFLGAALLTFTEPR